MKELINFMNSVYSMSDVLQEHLHKAIKTKSLSKKDFLLKAGQINSHIYFIHIGLPRACYIKDNTEVSSWFMKENDIIVSIDSFYNQQPGYEFIQALEDSELFYIEYKELEFIYKTFLEFNFIGRVLTIKYLQLWARQLYSIRNQPAQERYQWFTNHHPEIALRVPAKYIASYLDITEITLSRIKGSIRKKGL